MRQRSRFTQMINGATTTITLQQSPVGWEVKGWTFQIGDVKSHAEGDPYLHDTFADYGEAIVRFSEACHLAVDEPFVPRSVSTQMVDIGTQEQIDGAAYVDRGSLDDVFKELRR